MNKVILIGNLTRDPELSTIPSGATVCKFGLAVNRRAGAGAERQADFYNITVWRAMGENCAKFLKKGSKVAIVGSIILREYDAKDGTKRMSVDVTADEVEFLTPRGTGGGEEGLEMQPVVDDSLPF